MASKYKQQADGRYKTNVWTGEYRNGRKIYKTLCSTKSSRDLERLVSEYEQKRTQGLVTHSSDVGIQEYALQWISAEKGLSETATKTMYLNIIEKHLSRFKNIPFEHFTRQNIQNLINDNQDKPRTCQQIFMTLKQISKAAENDRLIPVGSTNEIFDRVQIPKYAPKEKQPLSESQCDRVIYVLKTNALSPRDALFLAVVYFCGLRREEALALSMCDINDDTIIIKKALHIGDKVTEIKPPKTERGYRTVPLTHEVFLFVNELSMKITPNADGYLFCMDNGKLITKSSYRKMWSRIENALGFRCTAHQFRHNYCTKLCYEAFENRTISTKQIAKLLGDTEKMVNDVYSHIVEEKEQTQTALESAFGCQRLVNEMSTNS